MGMTRHLRSATKRFVRYPLLTIGAVLAISIGLGGAIGVVRIIDAALFAPLELHQADRVMVVSERRASGETFNSIAPDELQQLTSSEGPFASVATVTTEDATFTSRGGAIPVRVARISPPFFDVFGVLPLEGRQFRREDTVAQSDDIAIVSEAFSSRHYSGERVAGQRMVVDGRPITIVGVIPSTFGFPQRVEIWRPAAAPPPVAGRLHYLRVVARRLDAVPDAAVNAYMAVVNARLAATSATGPAHALAVTPFAKATLGDIRQTLILVGVAVASLLVLTACSVVTLLFARTWARRREYALKAALGATRARLFNEPLWESVLMTLPAGVLAVAFANAGIRAIHVVTENRFAALNDAVLDGPTAVFAIILVGVVAFGIGIVPALGVISHAALSRGTLVLRTGRQRLPHALVAVQVGLAVVLASGAGLFAKSLYRSTDVDTGMAADEIVTWRVALPATHYAPSAVPEFYRSTFERFTSLAQVRNVSATLALPFSGSGSVRTVKPRGSDDAASLRVAADVVGPGYFATMGVPVLSGRDFAGQDMIGAPTVLAISASLARAVFGTVDAVGRTIVFDDSFGRMEPTIVAVVDDVRTSRTAPRTALQTYSPGLRSPRMAFVIRLREQPKAADLLALQTMVRAAHPELPFEFRPLADLLFDEISLPVLRTGLLMVFAGQAILIAAISVVGLIRWRVTQRAPEMALRVALGATPGRMHRLVLRSELTWVFAGIVAGTIGAVIVTPMARSMLTLVDPFDASVLLATIAAILTIALAAVVPVVRPLTINAPRLLAEIRNPDRS
jgi:putative ABC transport system permease protein